MVEKHSIDECFLDMSGTHKIYPDPIAIAHTIKDKIRDVLGFTVNVGIGDCKILAKMASNFEKPDKVHTLYRYDISQKMWPLPVRDLFSVGASTAEKLEKARIRTIGDLASTPLDRVQNIVGIKMGKQIHDYANGIDDSPVLAVPEEAKGYSISTTLEEDVVTAEQAHKVLLALADSVTARMRADNVKAYCVTVSVRSNDFKTRSHQKKLMDATDISTEVYKLCKQLFAELWDGHTPLRLLGVALTDLTKEDTAQLSLFPDERKERSRNLDKHTMPSTRSLAPPPFSVDQTYSPIFGLVKSIRHSWNRKRALNKKAPMSGTSRHGCFAACKIYICTEDLLGGI